MFGNPLVLEMAQVAVEEAMRLGASFADVRFEVHQHEDLVVRDGRLEQAVVRSDRGLGVRALVNGAWGFAAVGQPSRHDAAVAARRAVGLARAAAVVQEHPIELVSEHVHCAVYRTPIERDPLAVPIEDKMELLMEIDGRLRGHELSVLSRVAFAARRARKLYVSSEGSEIDQDLVQTSIGYLVGASDGGDLQTCTFGSGPRGVTEGRGWELVESLPLLDSVEEVVDGAVALLRAEPCPQQSTTVILGGSQVALQLHDTCARALELDRVVGCERDGSGPSFLSPGHLGGFELASEHVTLYADATLSGGVGTYGFDDEGVEAQRVDLVVGGKVAGFLGGRETAGEVGLERSSGSMRASSWWAPPSVRMSNVCMVPEGTGTLDDLIADTPSGILIDKPTSWSTDDRCHGFAFAGESAWEIKDGKRTRLLKNPTYSGVSDVFWRGCDAICGEDQWEVHGVSGRAKGQPVQLIGSSHGVVPARFVDVQVGSYQGRPPVRRPASQGVDHPQLSSRSPEDKVTVSVPEDVITEIPTAARPARRRRPRRRPGQTSRGSKKRAHRQRAGRRGRR